MDSITHTVIGCCLGEAIAGKKLGKRAMLYGVIANNLPDIDVFSSFWYSQAHELLAHRGITHSILFAIVFTPLLSWLFRLGTRNKELSFKKWQILIGSGLFLHIFLDALTAYGTGWFEPFSHYRVSFNTLFILDPFFSVPLIIAAILLLSIRIKAQKARKWVNIIGGSLSIAYLLVTICIKLYVNQVVKTDLTSKNIPYGDYLASPSPMNNLLWYSVAKADKGYYTGYYSLLDEDTNINWGFSYKNDSLLDPYKKSEDVNALIQFAKDYYCVSKKDSFVQFSDIRFGQVGGWRDKQAEFVFKFNIKKTASDSIVVRQAEFKELTKEDFRILIERVKGNK
jgi:inner membrane protein